MKNQGKNKATPRATRKASKKRSKKASDKDKATFKESTRGPKVIVFAYFARKENSKVYRKQVMQHVTAGLPKDVAKLRA